MTRKEIELAQKSLPRRVEWANWTEEQRKLSRELDCREMINSCLCYHDINAFWEECPWRYGKDKSYAAPYVRDLGVERVLEICKEQERDFSKARVYKNTYTDSEGLSYNSIVWHDELEERGA